MVDRCTYCLVKYAKQLFIIVLPVLAMISCESRLSSVDTEFSPVRDSIQVNLERYSDKSRPKNERENSLDMAFEYAKKLPLDTAAISKYSSITDEYRKLRNPVKFRTAIMHLDQSARRISDSFGIAKAYFYYGRYYLGLGNIDSAYANYYRAERAFAGIGDSLEAGKSMLSMAIIQKRIRDYVGGEESTVRAIKYLEPTNDERYLASAHNNLGLIANELNRYSKAITAHQKALYYRQRLKKEDRHLVSSSFNNLGIVYNNLEDYKKAIEYYNRGLEFDSLFEKRAGTYARLLDNKAYSEFLSGKNDNLPEGFYQALEIRDSLGENSDISTSYLHLAEYYKEKDSLSKALDYAKLALSKAQSRDYHRGILESLTLLRSLSPPEEANAYSEQYIRLSDSLEKDQLQYSNQFALVRYDTETIKLEKERADRRNRQLLILLLSMLVILLITYIFFQQKSNRKELSYRENQQKANEEIYNLMLSQNTKFEEGKQLEKQRISEELHDGILSKMFGIRLNLDNLNSKTGDEAKQQRSRYLNELKSIENEVRQISHELNANELLNNKVYLEMIEDLLVDTCNANSLSYSFDYDPDVDWERVSSELKINLYRMLQESLQNIIKHARASHVDVRLHPKDNRLVMEVEDNGIGLNPQKVKKGIGLKNMRSRSQKMGGEFDIRSGAKEGTLVSFTLNM